MLRAKQKPKKKKSQIRELLETLVGAALLAAFIMVFIARAFTVEGPSMMPTLHNGERLLVDKISYRFIEPSRGEIVVFQYPANPREHFIKRIIGVPGDTVEITEGRVYINGQVVEENYIMAPPRSGFAEAVVPDDHYFVLGDNRNNSEDSRDRRVGFVPENLLVGRAVWRYWPVTRLDIIRPPDALAEVN